eukprot:5059231-Prorocentrum_lima.AAC.1
MTSSLVGSEMCIRDSLLTARTGSRHARRGAHAGTDRLQTAQPQRKHTVSYTHLTLPTICSV